MHALHRRIYYTCNYHVCIKLTIASVIQSLCNTTRRWNLLLAQKVMMIFLKHAFLVEKECMLQTSVLMYGSAPISKCARAKKIY